MGGRRILGAVTHINPRGSLNTATPYVVTSAAPISYIDPDNEYRTDIWARTLAFAANLRASVPTALLIGWLSTGVAAGTHGGQIMWQLESWIPRTDPGWLRGGTSRLPGGIERGLGPRTWAPLLFRAEMDLACALRTVLSSAPD